MATLFVLQPDGVPAALPLAAARYALGDARPRALAAPALAPVSLIAASTGSGSSWALIVSPGHVARVNGLSVAGLRMLADRDEITCNGSVAWFSRASLPRMGCAPVPAGRLVRCARCSTVLEATRVVPTCGCGAAYCDDACRAYEPECAGCGLEAGGDPAWSPGELL